MEVLATLALAAIVLPPVVHGILLCLSMAGHARDQARAASLAQSKLDELVVSREVYESEMEGDFGEDLPGFTWTAQVNDWDDSGLVEVNVSVVWERRDRSYDVTLSTLVYMGQSSE